MRRNQIGAIRWTVERNLAFFAATLRTNFVALSRAKTLRTPFGANRACGSLCHCQELFPSQRENSVYPMARFEPTRKGLTSESRPCPARDKETSSRRNRNGRFTSTIVDPTCSSESVDPATKPSFAPQEVLPGPPCEPHRWHSPFCDRRFRWRYCPGAAWSLRAICRRKVRESANR